MSKFHKGDFVKIYGSFNLIWEITDVKSDKKYEYIYFLDTTAAIIRLISSIQAPIACSAAFVAYVAFATLIPPFDMALIDGDFIKKKLPWIAECLLLGTEYSKFEDYNEINETTPLLSFN